MNTQRKNFVVQSLFIFFILTIRWVTAQELFVNKSDECGMTAPVNRGIAIGDYNNDGFLDVYLCHSTGPSHLYKNIGQNHFVDVTDETGVGVDGLTAAATWIDYDNDGDLGPFHLLLLGSVPTLSK